MYAGNAIVFTKKKEDSKKFPPESLMRSHTYWSCLEQEIEKRIKECSGCQIAAKAPSINTQH